MAVKYFLFSSTQARFRRDTELKLGRTYIPGQVIVKGVKHSFTELCTDKNSSRYSDAEVVAYGDTNHMKYTMPKTI